MNPTVWMIVLVGITAVGFLLQGIALILVASRIKASLTRTQRILNDLERRGNQILVQAASLVDSLKPLGNVAKTVTENVNEIVDIARRRTSELDSFIREVTETLKVQATKLDYVVTDTVQKFEQTTATIQRDVLLPAMEIASLIKGIRTGFDYLFSKKRDREARPVTEDEEMFI